MIADTNTQQVTSATRNSTPATRPLTLPSIRLFIAVLLHRSASGHGAAGPWVQRRTVRRSCGGTSVEPGRDFRPLARPGRR